MHSAARSDNIQSVAEQLPDFRYHPDPIGTGSIAASDAVCEVCGHERGLVYQGPVFAVDEVESICPWCIADGSAAARFDGQFTDLDNFGWGNVPVETKNEVLRRTPGFAGWQQETWMAHCADATIFLGRAGSDDLRRLGPKAIDAIKSSLRDYRWSEDELDRYIDALDADGEPTAYLFRCTRCAAYVGYSDSG